MTESRAVGEDSSLSSKSASAVFVEGAAEVMGRSFHVSDVGPDTAGGVLSLLGARCRELVMVGKTRRGDGIGGMWSILGTPISELREERGDCVNEAGNERCGAAPTGSSAREINMCAGVLGCTREARLEPSIVEKNKGDEGEENEPPESTPPLAARLFLPSTIELF